MGLFGSDEYTDYTLLKKKGLLKIKEEKTNKIEIKDGFVDLTNETINAIEERTNDGNANSSIVPNMDFLNNLAGVGVSNSEIAENEENNLKIKIDELERKVNIIIERIEKLESRFND
ncbi:MAG: hypothetical protein N3D20_01080 [Candidatus Pacearchaeota archaeon]|nr:hypothetical protein [Candidatus Pacearchaeota archaeon]